MIDALEDPLDECLQELPLPLVALVGRTDLHHCLTCRVRDSYDELHARYISLPENTAELDHTPLSEDTAVILKRDWLHKRTYLVPGVAALWFRWEAHGAGCCSNSPSVMDIAKQVEAFRSRSRKSTKLVLVLVHTLESGEHRHVIGHRPSPKDDDRISQLRRCRELVLAPQ